MTQISTDRLTEMVTEALERTCFMVSDPSDAEAVEGQGYTFTHAARIAYSGPEGGYVYVVATDGFLEELASSLLGCEPEEISLEREGQDAIKELSNIMGGSVTLELGGDKSAYSLGLPEDHATTVARTGVETYIESCYGALRVCWAPGQASESKAA